jgi:hypothetical protein
LRGMLGIGGFVLLAALIAGSASPNDRLVELRSRFAQETNPVKKAKLMPRLGEAEFREIHSHVKDERLADALAGLEQYRAEAQECAKGLDSTGIDAEKHSAGFKQLQISLRESLRRLDHLIVGLTGEEQASFRAVREDLDQIDRDLLHKLFPRQPPAGTPSKKGKE